MDSIEVKVGRPCSVCGAKERRQIEDALYANTPVSQISQLYQVSSHAIYRHLKNHASSELQASFSASIKMNPASIAQRMLDVADSAREVRQNADSDAMKLKAGQAELQVLTALSVRMGVTNESLPKALEDAAILAAAIGDLSKARPAFGEALVDKLAKQGADEMASVLSALITDSIK